jgi:SAM-dependent methyltransferase
MPYPSALAEALRETLELDGSGRLLDIGCGPGSLTFLLAPFVTEAVGIDASAAMIREAEAHAPAGTRFVQLRAEELPAGLGTFRLAVAAQSFHWLDGMRVAAAVHGMLDPEGAFVHVGGPTHEGDGDVPRDEIEALIVRYAGERPPTRSDERALIAAAGFDGPVVLEIARGEVYERTPDDVVASVFSLSYGSPARFGDNLPAFERDLRALLGDRVYHERPRDLTALVYRRLR